MTTSVVLTIANVSIGQDSQSRYCLNDLHKAAGNDKRYQSRKPATCHTTQ